MTSPGPDYFSNENPHKGNKGAVRAWAAMKNSLSGLGFAIREESAFRQELTLAVVLIPLGLFLPVGPIERVLLVGSVLLAPAIASAISDCAACSAMRRSSCRSSARASAPAAWRR